MFTAAEAMVAGPVPRLASVTLSIGTDDPEPPICSAIKVLTPPSVVGAEPGDLRALGTVALRWHTPVAGGG